MNNDKLIEELTRKIVIQDFIIDTFGDILIENDFVTHGGILSRVDAKIKAAIELNSKNEETIEDTEMVTGPGGKA